MFLPDCVPIPFSPITFVSEKDDHHRDRTRRIFLTPQLDVFGFADVLAIGPILKSNWEHFEGISITKLAPPHLFVSILMKPLWSVMILRHKLNPIPEPSFFVV